MRGAASSHLFLPVCAALLGGCGSDGNDTAASDEMSGMPSAGGSATTGGTTSGSGGATSGGGGASGDASPSGGHAPGGGGGGGVAVAHVDAGGADAPSGVAGGGGAAHKADKAPFDWVGIIGTGQSLSTGCGTAAVSTSQPFHNLKLLDQGPDPKYPIDGSTSAKWSAIPLVEPIRTGVTGYAVGEYPNNICNNSDGYGETPHSGMANAISAEWTARGQSGDYVTAHTVVGVGGVCLAQMQEGTRSYKAALSEARVFKKLAADDGKTYGVGGIILTHGECDTLSATPQYGSLVFAFLQAYNRDLKAITSQTRDVVLFASQESSIVGGDQGPAVQTWQAGRDHPGQIVCTGPKYAYAAYGVHLPAAGYERLGEKYGEVFDIVVNQGIAWKPVGPNKVARSGAVITADFDVPNPPLVWDQHLATPHQKLHTAWAKGRGFEVRDGAGNELTIASTEIQGSSIVVTLASTPAAGAKLTLAYAVTQDSDPGQWLGGYDSGLHGLLRDSDDFSSLGPEAIDVHVTKGSTALTPSQPKAFARRSSFDIVTGGTLPADTIVMNVGGDQMTLSAPWPGPSGTASLSFHHDQHNYCVHFALPIP